MKEILEDIVLSDRQHTRAHNFRHVDLMQSGDNCQTSLEFYKDVSSL